VVSRTSGDTTQQPAHQLIHRWILPQKTMLMIKFPTPRFLLMRSELSHRSVSEPEVSSGYDIEQHTITYAMILDYASSVSLSRSVATGSLLMWKHTTSVAYLRRQCSNISLAVSANWMEGITCTEVRKIEPCVFANTITSHLTRMYVARALL